MKSPIKQMLSAESTSQSRSNLTDSDESEAWLRVLRDADALAGRLDGEASCGGPRLKTAVSRLEACPPGSLNVYSEAVAEFSDLVGQAHKLVDLDPQTRDPFWALRDLISDITSGIESVLDRAFDPLFCSDEALDRYLEAVRDSDGIDLAAVLKDRSEDQARRRLVAALVYRLARSRDAVGITLWFQTPRPQLENLSPQAVIESKKADAARLLLPLARSSNWEAASLDLSPQRRSG
jgi:hypothetical protein